MTKDPSPQSGPSSRSLWRDDETATDVDPPVTQPESRSVWRQDEGQIEQASPPSIGKTVIWSEQPASASEDGSGTNGARTKAKSHAKPKSIEPRRRRGRRIAWAIVGVLLLAFIVDGATAIVSLRSSLEASAEDLSAGRRFIGAGRLDAAAAAFDDAQEAASDAEGILSRPSIKLVSYVPLIDRDVAALKQVAGAAERVAAAGGEGVALAVDLGVSEDGLAASLYEDGVVQLDQIESAQPRLAEIAALLGRVEKSLFQAERPLFPPLEKALSRARSEVATAAESARDGAALFEGLPELLGAAGQRRYLLAFQATGEARATGGVIGLYGILNVDDGRLQLGRIGPYADVVPIALPDAVEAPSWFESSYGPQYALRQWQQANSSPNFPVVGEVLLDMFERGEGDRLDGVIAMDPIALERMMQGTGPLTVPGEGEIAAHDVADLLLKESYERFDDPLEQDLYLASLVDAFWSKIKAGDFDPAAFATGVGEATRTRHLSIYSRTADTQEAMSEIGAAGTYADAGQKNVQMVFHNNYSVNKVDYFLRRSTATEVRLTENGEALVTTEVLMENLAPSGPPSLLLGKRQGGDQPGLNRMLFNVLAPRDATFEKIWVDGSEVPVAQYVDEKFPVAWDVLEIPPGEDVTVTVSYRVVNAVSVAKGIPRLRYRLVPQALSTPEKFALTIEAPSGLALAEGHPDTPGVRRFTTSGVLDGSRTFDFVLVNSSS